MISEATILEFQAAVQEEYGVRLSKCEAADALYGLRDHFDLLAQIAAQDNEYEEPNRHDK